MSPKIRDRGGRTARHVESAMIFERPLVQECGLWFGRFPPQRGANNRGVEFSSHWKKKKQWT